MTWSSPRCLSASVRGRTRRNTCSFSSARSPLFTCVHTHTHCITVRHLGRLFHKRAGTAICVQTNQIRSHTWFLLFNQFIFARCGFCVVGIKTCSHTGPLWVVWASLIPYAVRGVVRAGEKWSQPIMTHIEQRVCASLTCCSCVSAGPMTERSVIWAWRRLACVWLPRSAAVDSNTHSSSSEAYTGVLISHTPANTQ